MRNGVVKIGVMSLFLFTACSTPFSSVKPKKNSTKAPKGTGVEVVEKVPLQEKSQNEIQDAGVATTTSVEKKHLSKVEKYLKTPEPFSLKSNEEDPELLGPQTTLKKPLLKEKEEEAIKELDDKNSESKKSLDKKAKL